MKVLISGYGRMGHMIEKVLSRQGVELAAATEDVCATPPELAAECVCIDFTFPQSFRANYKFLADNFKAVVVGTTGWDDIRDEVIKYFEKKGTPMIYASNFSIGVNALFAAVSRTASILKGHGYEPSIEEIHHIHKLDAPSGTAKSLAALVKDSMDDEVPISAKREGEVPGTHTVIFTSTVDKITFTHEAFSREGFAVGAVYAAMMTEEIRGVHEFKDLIL
ncbi:MAG: 4-hydroxy-tetrahydrodipicolinate reductase [Bacteroidales bacterium]|nr:4-hydroxy-tetrahydrodipicolinate reductase [Bacteroidales bacterium]MBR5432728.1 4-hydroxy-tetrahydrodipicolinate reductase [Bacteroidales bacterium]